MNFNNNLENSWLSVRINQVKNKRKLEII